MSHIKRPSLGFDQLSSRGTIVCRRFRTASAVDALAVRSAAPILTVNFTLPLPRDLDGFLGLRFGRSAERRTNLAFAMFWRRVSR